MKRTFQIVVISFSLATLHSCYDEPCASPDIDWYHQLEQRYETCLELLGEDIKPYPGVNPFTESCLDCYLHNGDLNLENCEVFIPCVEELCVIPGTIDGNPNGDC